MAAGVLVATGFVRIDSDTKPAMKAIQALGSIGASALSTGLLPALASVTAGFAALGGAALAAAGAAAVYGAAVVPQFQEVSKAMKQQTVAEDARTKAAVNASIAQDLARQNGFKYGQQVKITADMTASARDKAKEYNAALSASDSSSKSATQAQALYKQQLSSMPQATQDTTKALIKLKEGVQEWSRSLASDTMPIFTQGIDGLRRLLPKLTPIVKETSAVIGNFVYSLGEGQAGKVFREFGDNVRSSGAGALKGFLDFSKNMVVGIIGILNAFIPMQDQVTGGLGNLGEKFADFGANLGQSQGFATFMKTVREGGPQVADTLRTLGRAFGDIASAAGPLAGVGIQVLKIFAALVEAIPTPVLELLVPAILAVNLGLKLYALYTAAAAAYTWVFTTANWAGWASLAALRIQLIALKIQQIALATWTGIVTAATWAWNAAMLVATSPITLVVLAIAALVAAIIWVAVKTTWFQTAWKYTWNAIKEVAGAVGRWFAGPFVDFFVAGWNLLKKYVIDPVVRFFTKTIPDAARALGRNSADAWNAMVKKFQQGWDLLQKYVVNPIVKFFTKTLPGAARTARDKTTEAFRWLVDKILGFFGNIITGAAKIFGWVPGVGGKLKKAAKAFQSFRDDVNRALGGIKNKNQTTFVTFKGKSIAAVSAGRMATGGRVNGPGTETSDDVPIMASRNEHMWTAKEVRGAGGHENVYRLRAMARKGQIPGFATGGAVNPTARVPSAKSINAAANDAYVGMVRKSSSALAKMRDDLEMAYGGNLNVGGSGVKRWTGAVKQALAQVGQSQAYVGITLRRMNQESGGNPKAVNKWDSNWKAGYPSVGLMQVIRPTFQSNAGKYRNTGPFMYGVSIAPIANLYASMRYALRAYGSLPRAYNRAGGYANGTGGTTRGYHMFGEHGPEIGFVPSGMQIKSARQTRSLMNAAPVQVTLIVENHGVIGSKQETENWLVDSLDQLKRKNRLPKALGGTA